jgi:hypothetical protein
MEIHDDMEIFLTEVTKARGAAVLKATLKSYEPEAEDVLWDHEIKNMLLKAEGRLSFVCPVIDDSESIVEIFNVPPEAVKKIMEDDPGVQAGVFTYEIFTCQGFHNA